MDVAPSMAKPEGGKEKITFFEHDLREVMQAVKQTVMSSVIVGFIHYKWEVAQPLIMAPTMGIVFVKSNAFKVHVLGYTAEGDLKRPWKKPNPFAALLGQQKPADAGSAEETIQDESKKDK